MSEVTVNNEDLEQGLNAIFGGILNLEETKAKEHAAYIALIAQPEIFKKAMYFHHEYSYPHRRAVEQALKEIKQPKTQTGEYQSVFLDYGFFDGHIRQLCTTFEGHSCCADKSRTIVGRYLNYLLTGETPMWEADQEDCYWLPKFGTQQQWHDLMHGLFKFKYGQPEAYLTAYRALFQAAMTKYKSLPSEADQ